MKVKKVDRSTVSKGRKVGVIFILGTLIAIGPFSIDAYLPAFKQIAGDFNVATSAIGFTLTTYFIGIGLGQLAYGPLMDKYGRRNPLIAGLLLYIVTSLLCAAAYDVMSLAVLRFFMALGACAGMVASKAVVRDLFDKEQVADVLSTLMLIMGIAPIIAPTIGGVIVASMHWQWVFYFLAIFAIIMLFTVTFFLPESFKPNKATRLHPLPVLQEYWGIYKNKDFFLFSSSRGFVIGMLLGYVAAAPFIFVEYFGMEEKWFGWFFGSNAAGLIAGSQVNRFFLSRHKTFDVTYVVSVLLTIVTISLLIYGLLWTPQLWIVFPGLFIMMTLIGFQNPNTTALALMPFTRRAGSASAFVGAVSMIFGSIASWFVASYLKTSLLPLFILIAFCGVMSHVAIETYRLRGR